ncbi:MAG: leucine/isoleucine/valine transporter permease subunit [Syntrophorhabdus sp. PtaU1.Bin058]|nr:MAG: leucine/isoleucine/valine transporter permease subunit [Syntrophorhabdus sp. PtaU1.Bin058]
MNIKTRHIWLILLALFAIVLPLILDSPFARHVLIVILLYSILGEAWSILGGYAGLLSFGQAAFFGIGAYTSTFLLINWGVSPWIGMIVGGFLAVLAAICLAYPCSKLQGHYFAIATLAFAEGLRIIFLNWNAVGGARGLDPPILPTSLWYLEFHESKLPYYYLLVLFLAVVMLAMWKLNSSRLGYYLRALRESNNAAESLGVNTKNCKVIATCISAFITAIAGTFYAQYVLYIDPASVMQLKLSIEIVLVTMFGGVGTMFGPLIGASFLTSISEIFRVVLGGAGRGMDLMIYGLLIMLISTLKPDGVWGLVTERLGRRPGKEKAKTSGE